MAEKEFERKARFVSNMVSVLIRRHKVKLNECNPEIDGDALIHTKGSAAMNKAATAVDKLEAAAEAAEQAFVNAVDKFTEVHGEAAIKLVEDASEKRRTYLAKQSSDFVFKVTQAIGLVELVSGDAAFTVLENCRNDVRKLV